MLIHSLDILIIINQDILIICSQDILIILSQHILIILNILPHHRVTWHIPWSTSSQWLRRLSKLSRA